MCLFGVEVLQYVMKRQRTKSALKTSFLQITTLCLLMVMTVRNGSFVPLARNHTTLNVLLLKLSNTFKPRDGHLLAPSMRVKVQKVPRVKRVNPLYPPQLTRSVKWVTKRVTYGKLVLLSYTMKKKFSKKGKGGKVHQTPEEKRDAMSHKNKRNQQWKEEKMGGGQTALGSQQRQAPQRKAEYEGNCFPTEAAKDNSNREAIREGGREKDILLGATGKAGS